MRLRDKLKGRRQSTNVEDRRDPVAGVIARDREAQAAKMKQELTGKHSMHLKDKTPLAKQKNDDFTKFMNMKGNEPKKATERAMRMAQMKDTQKPTRLTDAVFPRSK